MENRSIKYVVIFYRIFTFLGSNDTLQRPLVRDMALFSIYVFILCIMRFLAKSKGHVHYLPDLLNRGSDFTLVIENQIF